MEDEQSLSIQLDKARKEESKARSEMQGHEQKINQQKSQLASCLSCRKECQDNMKAAKSSGLSVLQIRECQLLVQHLDTVVETHLYKIKLCEKNHDEAKTLWQEKNEYYLGLKETAKSSAIEEDKVVGKVTIKKSDS